MLNSSTLARSLEGSNARAPIAAVHPSVDRFTERRVGNWFLEFYLEGWAEADPAKVGAAVTAGYRFCDPLVGTFSQRSLHEYFNLLQDRLDRMGPIVRSDMAFFLQGPVDQSSCSVELWFWREAPRIGLTGFSGVKVSEQGVVAETVEYDLNLASDMLRRASRWQPAISEHKL